MQTLSKTTYCRDCNEIIHVEWTLFCPQFCDTCLEKRIESERKAAVAEAQATRHAAFAAMVPPLYRETDKTRLAPILRNLAENWKYSEVGLGIVGAAGEGKTRAATLILERMHSSGYSVSWLSATRFSAACATSFSSDATERDAAKKTIRNAERADLLLLDDIGKQRMTDRAEMQFYDLLEHRTSHHRPTIWTSNSDAAGLHSMFSIDRADALIRRLSEFSQIIKL